MKSDLNALSRQSKNPFTSEYTKYFSQADEVRITMQILERISGIETIHPTFLEFGCGNGLENNSPILVTRGWQGIMYSLWVCRPLTKEEAIRVLFKDYLMTPHIQVELRHFPNHSLFSNARLILITH